jgi:hypothetical protein
VEIEGQGQNFAGSVGGELNYGAAPNLQLSAALPLAYSHDASGWRWGTGDVELSAKYRFLNDKRAGVQVATFPAITLPTASNGLGTGHVTALLPVWIQKDTGPWSIFGGGGYAINTGDGNRDYWRGGIAVTRTFGERLLLGIETDRQGADTVDGSGSTSLGIGAIYKFHAPWRLLASGGPTFDDHRGKAGFHAYVALGLDL